MDIFLINDHQVTLNPQSVSNLPVGSFLWIDTVYDEIAADREGWRDAVESITGIQIYDLHLNDAVNLKHPSYFDSTQDYEMLVFRKLASHPNVDSTAPIDDAHRITPALTRLATEPVTFLLMDHALITVRAAHSRTIDAARKRLLEYRHKSDRSVYAGRHPGFPKELMLRLLSAMVDQYLDLRQPLTAQIDRWQRALLNPRRPFTEWTALLEARMELRKLDRLCEEQHDALQELHNHFIDTYGGGDNRAKDLLLVRINDVMEHITRVLNHARRLESSIESTVQIHFSAMAHRTSEIMRTLTVITALFMPLTVITGIFGMNFVEMPLLKDRTGFWITLGMMASIVIGLLAFFRRKRYLEDRPRDNRP